jgi:predicted TIM-barrel fold metal-dependent hydrolase
MHLSAVWASPTQLDQLVAEYRQVADHVWLHAIPGPHCLGNAEVLAAATAHPEFFVPFALIDFTAPVSQLTEYRDAGFRGLKVLTAGGPFSADRCLPYYREAERLDMPVAFHTGSVPAPEPSAVGFGCTTDYHPLELERIARVCPHLVIIALHGGGFFWREALVAAHSAPNIYLALGDFDSAAGMCLDNLASWDMLGLLQERILAGLDYPYAASLCGKPEPFTPTAQVLPAPLKLATLATRLTQRLGAGWCDAVMSTNARRIEERLGIR